MHSFEEPVYQISVVAQLLGIHPQTLRHYEREGLVIPSRTGGNIRIYSQKDIDDIKLILRLTRELGVNLAGVDIIFQLKRELSETTLQLETIKRQQSQHTSIVAKNRQIVVKKTNYKVVVFDEWPTCQ